MFTSQAVRAAALALPCAFALHLAFPRANMPWLAFPALAGLFAAWMSVPPRVAALIGFLAGLVYFSADFTWFGETAGALLGPFGGLLDIGPAALEALAFACAGLATALSVRQLSAITAPIVIAATFTLAEIARSSGPLGAPLYQVGAAFVDTPLAALAAFGGVYSVTFSIALLAAGVATFTLDRHRGAGQLVIIGGFVGASALYAWFAWPARTLPAAKLRVAAVQGNITQSVKWDAASLPLAVERYTTLTRSIRAFQPRFVLWPETVITTDLRVDATLAADPLNAQRVTAANALQSRFGALARELGAFIVVGTNEATATDAYNDLVFFAPNGKITTTYRKRKLVPFAEYLPGPSWMRGLPFASLVSDVGHGGNEQPLGALGAAPLICWEAGFSELAQREAARGATFFAIATDDAWFGTSDGPYAQAQLAQLRAIETGRWVVRAAATGISGIIAPDGTWRARSTLGTQAVITGTIGAPVPTFYSRLGPLPVTYALLGLSIVSIAVGRRRRQ